MLIYSILWNIKTYKVTLDEIVTDYFDFAHGHSVPNVVRHNAYVGIGNTTLRDHLQILYNPKNYTY